RESYGFLGVAADTSDKWFTKASTSASKYFLMRLFLLSAGDDPDQTSGASDESPAGERPRDERPISPAQQKRLWAIARSDAGLDADVVHRIVWYCLEGLTAEVDEIPRERYDAVVERIRAYSRNVEAAEAALRAFEEAMPLVRRAEDWLPVTDDERRFGES